MKNVFLALILFLFAAVPIFTYADSSSDILKEINAHLTIKDYQSACDAAAESLFINPSDPLVWEAYIKALAKKKDEKGMLYIWDNYCQRFGNDKMPTVALENIAWGVIEANAESPSPLIRALSMIAALFSQDGRGCGILRNALHDTNASIRAIAAQLAGELHDDLICDTMLDRLNQEVFWKARLEIIKSLGKMEISDAKPLLIKIIETPHSTFEEKTAATEALVRMLDTVERQSLQQLTQSQKAGLRYLSCELASNFDLKEDLDLIVPLLKDPRCEVRAAALETMGVLRAKEIDIVPLLTDPDPLVAIYAAWVQTLNDPKKGQVLFKAWLSHSCRNERLLASAALAACGKYGLPLTLQAFKGSSDLYVRMNLAVGLIRQGVSTQQAAEALYQGFITANERWMWEEKGIFKYLAPSTLKHIDEVPHYPEAVNQLTRLEILNILAIMRHPHAQDLIKTFIQEKKWGVSGIAAAMLLTEGDDSALDLVQNLLQDPDANVRFQAALILALWGKGKDALSTLQEAYAESDRDTKEKILEGICKVGSPSSLLFLIERLKEPYPSLRIIAAAGILICLNH